jgi:hypothetical protein
MKHLVLAEGPEVINPAVFISLSSCLPSSTDHANLLSRCSCTLMLKSFEYHLWKSTHQYCPAGTIHQQPVHSRMDCAQAFHPCSQGENTSKSNAIISSSSVALTALISATHRVQPADGKANHESCRVPAERRPAGQATVSLDGVVSLMWSGRCPQLSLRFSSSSRCNLFRHPSISCGSCRIPAGIRVTVQVGTPLTGLPAYRAAFRYHHESCKGKQPCQRVQGKEKGLWHREPAVCNTVMVQRCRNGHASGSHQHYPSGRNQIIRARYSSR